MLGKERRPLLWTAVCLLFTLPIFCGSVSTAGDTVEPSYQQACGWWPEQKKQWTGVGWAKWPHEFIVFWNGNICRDRKEGTDHFLLSFATGDVPDFGQRTSDDRKIPQSLLDGYLP